MSENKITEDEVISQDDIDKLLNASNVNEDEEIDSSTADDADNDLAELSQDDIDSLLNGAPLGPDSSENKVEDEKSDGLELVSQDDIDQLMNAGSFPDDSVDSSPESVMDREISEPMVNTENDDDDDEDDDFDFISMDDVKTLMDKGSLPDDSINSSSDTDRLKSSFATDSSETVDIGSETLKKSDESEKSPASSGEPEEPEELELVSQDDIDKLMNGDFEDATSENQIPDEEKPEVLPASSPDTSIEKEIDEQVLDESEAVGIEDCLITQETIDQLIQKDLEEPPTIPEPARQSDSDSAEASDSGRQQESEEQNAEEPEPEEPELEKSESETPEPETPEYDAPDSELKPSESDDVTQDDIDNILKDSDKESEDTSEADSNLISQDEINKLLEGTEEEDEDILGKLDEESSDADMDSEDAYNIDDGEDVSKKDNQVILEETEENEADQVDSAYEEQTDPEQEQTKDVKDKFKKKWYKSRLVIAGFGIVCLFLSLAGGYFFFFHGKKPGVKSQNQTALVKSNPGIKTQTGDIKFDESVSPKGPGSKVMKDFIVFSPVKNKNLSYIAADISIYYSEGTALAEIQKHLPFYRGVIYDTIKKFLTTENKKKISEKNLSGIIKNALNQAMPKAYITEVMFTDFKTG